MQKYELTTSAELKCTYTLFGKLPMTFFIPAKYLLHIDNFKEQNKTKQRKKPKPKQNKPHQPCGIRICEVKPLFV